MKQTIYNPALRETIVFLKTASETNSSYSELEISLGPGGGNPMHYHKSYTELFTAVKGELGLELKNGQTIILKPGESYLVKTNEPHRFYNPGDQHITFTNRVEPGSTGLEYTLRILSGLARDGHYSSKNIPKNILHLAVCGSMSDMRLSGIMGMITSPVIKTLAKVAKRTGVEEQLIENYCI